MVIYQSGYLIEVLALLLQRRGLLLPLVDALVVAVALAAQLPDLRAGGEHLDHRCGHEVLQFLQWRWVSKPLLVNIFNTFEVGAAAHYACRIRGPKSHLATIS